MGGGQGGSREGILRIVILVQLQLRQCGIHSLQVDLRLEGIRFLKTAKSTFHYFNTIKTTVMEILSFDQTFRVKKDLLKT